MIITLKGCTASAYIGGLNFYKISKGTVSGSTVTINASTINTISKSLVALNCPSLFANKISQAAPPIKTY